MIVFCSKGQLAGTTIFLVEMKVGGDRFLVRKERKGELAGHRFLVEMKVGGHRFFSRKEGWPAPFFWLK